VRLLHPATHAHLQFPSTSWDLLTHASSPRGDGSAEALNEFAERYYAAVRAFIATAVRHALDADDLTQRFFETVVLSGRLLAHADQRKGSFRPYLKQAIRNFLVDERRRAARAVLPQVRPDTLAGGWNDVIDQSSCAPDEALLRAWAQRLVAMAMARLETRCLANGQAQHFQIFAHRYLTERQPPPTWREVGEAFGLDEKTARGRAATAARHFRGLLRQLIASDLGSEQTVDDELHAMMAVL
jgi:RNA polymerase sigma factor (sigma-70 family)